ENALVKECPTFPNCSTILGEEVLASSLTRWLTAWIGSGNGKARGGNSRGIPAPGLRYASTEAAISLRCRHLLHVQRESARSAPRLDLVPRCSCRGDSATCPDQWFRRDVPLP